MTISLTTSNFLYLFNDSLLNPKTYLLEPSVNKWFYLLKFLRWLESTHIPKPPLPTITFFLMNDIRSLQFKIYRVYLTVHPSTYILRSEILNLFLTSLFKFWVIISTIISVSGSTSATSFLIPGTSSRPRESTSFSSFIYSVFFSSVVPVQRRSSHTSNT